MDPLPITSDREIMPALPIWLEKRESFSSGPIDPLRSLTELSLHDNQIGDAGMIELYSSIARGSLPSLQMLSVDEGPLGNEYPLLKAVCEARGIYLPWGLRR